MTNLGELKWLAEAATPGKWRVESTIYRHMAAEIVAHLGIAQIWHGENAMDDAAFIAAANPAAILSLIERVEKAEAKAATARSEALEEAVEAAWTALNRILIKEDSSSTHAEDHIAAAIRALGEKAG